MFEMGMMTRGARRLAVVGIVLVAGACAQTQPDGLKGNVTPGSGQDFVVNVGDRVFFEEDKSTLKACSSTATVCLHHATVFLLRRWHFKTTHTTSAMTSPL